MYVIVCVRRVELVLVLLCSTWRPFIIAVEEREPGALLSLAGVLWLSVFCVSSSRCVSLSVECDRCISW